MPEILKHEAILKYGKLIKKLCELTENTTEHDEDMILVSKMLYSISITYIACTNTHTHTHIIIAGRGLQEMACSSHVAGTFDSKKFC